MKATQYTKAISLMTISGILLVGCGGGPSEDTRSAASSASTLPSSSPTPYVTPTTSGGSGSTGYSSNETTDQIYANQQQQNKKLDEILNESKSANSNAKKASKSANLGMIFGGVALGLLAIERFQSMMEFNRATRAATGSRASLGKQGLAFLTNRSSDQTNANDLRTKIATGVTDVNTNTNAKIDFLDTREGQRHQDTQNAVGAANGLATESIALQLENSDKLDKLVDMKKTMADMKKAIEDSHTKLMEEVQKKPEAYTKALNTAVTTITGSYDKLMAGMSDATKTALKAETDALKKAISDPDGDAATAFRAIRSAAEALDAKIQAMGGTPTASTDSEMLKRWTTIPGVTDTGSRSFRPRTSSVRPTDTAPRADFYATEVGGSAK